MNEAPVEVDKVHNVYYIDMAIMNANKIGTKEFTTSSNWYLNAMHIR
jgi:hypothetical protein